MPLHGGRGEKAKMLAGDLYHTSAPEVQPDQATTMTWPARYNSALTLSPETRRKLFA